MVTTPGPALISCFLAQFGLLVLLDTGRRQLALVGEPTTTTTTTILEVVTCAAASCAPCPAELTGWWAYGCGAVGFLAGFGLCALLHSVKECVTPLLAGGAGVAAGVVGAQAVAASASEKPVRARVAIADEVEESPIDAAAALDHEAGAGQFDDRWAASPLPIRW